MEQTWRWYGPNDPVSLADVRQAGATGVVTALHHIPNGEVWSVEEILKRKAIVEDAGLVWSVVESVPIHEDIKTHTGNYEQWIANYQQTLRNLAQCGIRTVCYNFMPVIDWVRTDLEHPMPDGTTALYFDYSRFAYFDMRILCRDSADKDYPGNILSKVEELDRTMTPSDRRQLIDTIIVKTQGFVNGNISEGDNAPVQHFRNLMSHYDGMDKQDLLGNLTYFLKAVMPVCHETGVRLCIHPDDPPMPVFGMPRIAGNAEDIRNILSAVDDFHNGLTFCAGSLSAGAHNDVVAMARAFAPRTHFVHLRSCNLLPDGNFIEAPHTSGRVDLVELIRIFGRQGRDIPMRVDHGRDMLGDSARGYNPGYSFHGRMLALGQVEGMMAAVKNEFENRSI